MKLTDLSKAEQEHWKRHLNALKADNPLSTSAIDSYLTGAELPKIEHPSLVHDWFEKPDERDRLEVKVIG